ncbi:MAG TPA: PH domain-containing protein, partial [Aquihabitans sp.]|nr:PH domain-containing protein [Aquihabitans sp.]
MSDVGVGNPLDGTPRRLHPSSPVLSVVLVGRQLLFPLVLLVFGAGRALITLPLVALGLGALVAVRVLAWSRFTYRIDHDALRIEHGLLNRQRREVPLRRIQQVDLQRKLRHRLLGVAVVRIDTAGGGSGAEVVLEAIGDADALALRGALLSRAPTSSVTATTAGPGGGAEPGGPGPGPGPGAALRPPPPAAPEVVVELTTRELVVAGITGSRLAGIVPLVGAAIGLFFELPDDVGESVARDVGDQLSAGIVLPLLAVLAVPVILALAALTSILTDHGYTLVRIGTDLHLRRGLLDQREATLSLQRIQVARLVDNPVRRRLGLASVQLQSAGSGSDSEGSVSRLTIPLVTVAERDRLLELVLPGSVPAPPLIPAPPAARRRAWVRRVGPVALVIALLVAATRSPWALLGLLALVPAGLLADRAYRSLGHGSTPAFVFARRGAVLRETVVVPVAKTQSSRVRSSPFQRRVGLATLHLDVAGRGRTPA